MEDARRTADQMIEDTKKESEIKLEGAIQKLNDGLVDKAISMAHEKLRAAFTDRDDEKIIEGFMSRVDEVKMQKGTVNP